MISTLQIIRETLAAEMRRDPDILLMGEDIARYGGAFGVTKGLLDEFGPERVRNTPISEQALVGTAIGAAVAGLRPVVEIMFSDFATLIVDQMVNMAAKLKPIYGLDCPLVVRLPSGGGRGYGATHSQVVERFFTGVPGLRILAPALPRDFSTLLQAALRSNAPTLLIEHKMIYPMRAEWDGIMEGERPREPHMENECPSEPRAQVAREGSDVTLIAWSWMTHHALAAAQLLDGRDVSAEVVDLRSLAPLDMDTLLASVQKTRRVVIVEEGPITGGFAAEIAARLADAAHGCLDAPVKRVAFPDFPVPAARALESELLPTPEKIADAAFDVACWV
ncbi:MAG: alpha-ketoacid dehydrogenase subunit beta [Kiritimatiellaeota bacterium]|nr:alpha-ketoacid dehydrogenase subunit beta [Kiritimatiellota bacterium]